MPSEGVNWYCNTSPTIVPHVSAAQLWETTLTATAAGDGDTVVLTTADAAAIAALPASDGTLNLAQHWNAVEWNVFGDCCRFQAVFSPGSTLVVNTTVNGGAVATCVQEGFTGETNNLSLVGTPTQNSAPPAIVFTQSDAAGRTPASCVFAPGGPPGKPPLMEAPVGAPAAVPVCRRAATLDASASQARPFRSLHDPWADTSTPHGPLILTALAGLWKRDLFPRASVTTCAPTRGVHMGRPAKLTEHQRKPASNFCT